MKQLVIEEDFDTVEIDGVIYSREIFKWFGIDADEGRLFRFVKRQDKSVTVELVQHLVPSHFRSNQW